MILKKAKKLEKQGKFKEAATEYRRGIELNPNFCWYYHNLGDVLAKQGDLDGAIASYQEALKLNSNSAWSYYKLGRALMERGLLNQAAKALKNALNLDFNYYEIHEFLGITYAKKRKWEPAIANYRKALEINSQSARVYHKLGEALEGIGRANEAIDSYKKARDLSPAWSEVRRKLGENYKKQGSWSEAAIEFQKALDLEQNDGFSSYQLGDVLRQLERNTEAIAPYQTAIELQPDNPKLYLRLGKTLTEVDRWSEAIEMYYRGLEFDPKNSKLCSSLGMAQAELGNWSESAVAYDRAVQSDPKNYKLHYRLGTSLSNLGRWQEAIAAYQNSIELKADYGLSYKELGYALSNLGNWSEAVTAYNQAIELCKARSYDFLKELHKQLAFALGQLEPSGNREIYDRIWNEFNSLDADFNPDYPAKLNREAATAEFMVNSEYKVVRLYSLNDEDRAYLATVNLSVEKLDLLRQAVAPEDVYHNFEVEEKLKVTKTTIPVSTGYLYSFCPKTDRVLRSNLSLSFNKGMMIYVYRFVAGDGEIFYLIGDGGMRFARVALYFPNFELVVRLEAHDWGHNIKDIEKLINWFKGYVVGDWGLVKSYLSNERPKGAAIIFGLYKIGHNLWNEYTGVHSLYEAGILDKVEGFLIGPNDFFNLDSVYPEISSDKIKRIPVEQIWETILENNYCVIPVFDIFVKEGLAKKMYEGAKRLSSPAVLEEVERAKNNFPLLWFNIRAHVRFWTSQVEGIANVINKLSEDFPNLGVVFDGWSRIKIGDAVVENAEVEQFIAKENALVKRISAQIPGAVDTYNTVGCFTYESVVWAYNIDVFIGPYGSGLTYVTWVANKPGVVHGNATAVGGTGEFIDLLTFREAAIKPDFISPEDVVDIGNFGMNNNYDCDWKAIYNKVLAIVKRLQKKRGL